MFKWMAKNLANRYQLYDARLLRVDEGREEEGGVVVMDGKIEDMGGHLSRAQDGMEAHSIGGKVLAPGLIDLNAFGEGAGFLGADAESGKVVSAALAGGVTSLALRGSTAGFRGSGLRCIPVAPLLVERDGRVMINEIGTLASGGGRVSDGVGLFYADGAVRNTRLLADCLAYVRDFSVTLMLGVEDEDLSRGGFISDGKRASKFGLATRPAYGELVQVARDVEVLREKGGRVIFGPLSYYKALRALERLEGVDEVGYVAALTPHHLLLDEDNFKISSAKYLCCPPLRSRERVDKLMGALVEVLKGGGKVCIMSGHRQRKRDDILHPVMDAAFGIDSVGDFLPALLEVGRRGGLGLAETLALATYNAARALVPDGGSGLCGVLRKGADADMIIFDPELERRSRANGKANCKASGDTGGDAGRGEEDSGESIFSGMGLRGYLHGSIVAGRVVWRGL